MFGILIILMKWSAFNFYLNVNENKYYYESIRINNYYESIKINNYKVNKSKQIITKRVS